jgi:hypothetical protein
MKLTISILVVIATFSANASLDSKAFVDCFVKAANETILEIREIDKKSDKKRMCNQLGQENVDKYISKFSEIQNGELVYYSKESMGKEILIDLYNYMKDDMNCYAEKGSSASLVGALINGPTYTRNTNLVEAALNKMSGLEMWDKFFSPSGYNKLEDIDFSYCSK